MTIRPYKQSDQLALYSMFKESGLKYSFPALDGPLMESVLIVADEEDRPVAAAAAERICQLYLLMKPDEHPAAKLHYIKMLHDGLAAELKAKGYHSCDAFIPPELEKSFGRRLMHTFNWVRNWPSFARHF